MTESMIERVAESQANFDGRKLINMPMGERVRYRQRARAAIEAMREPTEAMRKAGWEETDQRDEYAVWCAMIDAALAEQPT